MTPAEVRTALLRGLGEVAPEVDLSTLRSDVSIRDQIDLDSFDFLTFVTGLHTRLGVDVPERDYSNLNTLDSAIAYLVHRLASASKP